MNSDAAEWFNRAAIRHYPQSARAGPQRVKVTIYAAVAAGGQVGETHAFESGGQALNQSALDAVINRYIQF